MKAVLTALAATLLSTAGALAQSPTNAAIEQILVERIDTAEQNVGIAVAVIENGAKLPVFAENETTFFYKWSTRSSASSLGRAARRRA